MVEGIFVYRLRSDIDMDEYTRYVGRMFELVTLPEFGLVDFTTFTALNGDQGIIAAFESLEHLQAWRNHPEHLDVQERGRQEWLESYWLGEIRRRAEFDRKSGRRDVATAL